MGKKGGKWKKSQKSSDKTFKSIGRPDDIIIPIMGATGAGKSTFINHYFGDTRASTSDSLHSCTPDVQHYIHTLPSKRRIVLVDTPGVNDSHEDDAEILRRVAVWLASAYDENMKVAGVIYLNDISQKRMYGSTRMNLAMFQRVCGPSFFTKVVMATTHWDVIPARVGETREQELRESFWKPILEKGGTVRRIVSKPKDVREAVNLIVAQYRRNETGSSPQPPSPSDALALQRELVELDKSIPMTTAGKELKGTLKDILDGLKHGINEEEDPQKKAELKRQLDSLKLQVKELNIPFGERIKGWFGLG
ncbi:P-loop containing nucleoside triphosphate hydrolase protein [Coprinopsis sp. MPI-PUGE-AT-0042]|nr:P-loop containing nucleoside triphosphate hydrolase protein [Coprinopsis sp. MPI-PUGE-AT-0042]